jgi:cyclophilin family peptidyl-prolyl cis-trans isomerase
MQLFEDLAPKTVSKFLDFVSGTKISTTKNIPLHYKDSKVSRVLAEGWIQVGGMRKNSNHRNTR